MHKTFSKFAAASIFSLLSLGALEAKACDLSDGGFIAQLIKCGAPEVVDEVVEVLDDLNGEYGHPVEEMGNIIIEGYVPGFRPF